MALPKQAKILTSHQQTAVLSFLAGTRYPIRNRVIFLLSVKGGLRAKEIAHLEWGMVTSADGTLSDAIALPNSISKGKGGGRTIPMNRELRSALGALHEAEGRPVRGRVVRTERSASTSAQAIVNAFASWYAALGFSGASSHSGRRSFITHAARKISTVGGSLRDVQSLAGHTSLQTTQRYIEADSEAQKRVVDL